MALWNESQRNRLAIEEILLADQFPHFKFRDHAKGGLTTIWGNHITAAENSYTLCIWIVSGFPYDIPSLYVTNPCPLYGYMGKTIQSYGTSHAMHVWETDWNNYVKICHWNAEHWSAMNTLVAVLSKGMLWLEAFEAHKRTGKNIDTFSLSF